MSKRILIVDDDRELGNTLSEQLHLHEDVSVEIAETGPDALKAIQQRQFDAVILDVDLPGIDGRELCRLVRRGGFFRPIIMLTAADGEADQILALEAGANDYVTKPFRLGILLARLRAHLRQHEMSDDAVFEIGSFKLLPGEKCLVDPEGKRIRLTDKETRLLKYLYRTRGRPANQEMLLKEVWGYTSDMETHTVETHIFRLRQKIGQDRSNEPLIVTERNGYRLAG